MSQDGIRSVVWKYEPKKLVPAMHLSRARNKADFKMCNWLKQSFIRLCQAWYDYCSTHIISFTQNQNPRY
jgi:hypothetical protein